MIKSLSVLLTTVVIAIVLTSVSSEPFTGQEMETMINTIDSYFFVAHPKFKMEIRKFLRAAFHDCMGGCDGSISLTNTDNRGLENFVKVVTEAYNTSIEPNSPNYTIFKRLSRADFWVLCE
jgi:hypothetical protein